MIKTLNVYLNRSKIGQLQQNQYGEMLFTYNIDWLNDPTSIAISLSLPLKAEAYTQKECRPFFAGLLPDENPRKLVAKNLGISANNDFSMLAEIGRECAGAVILLPESETLDTSKQQYHKLMDAQFANVLQSLPLYPLLAGEDHVRLSLAGAQDKTSIYLKNDKVYIPMNGAISSHIIKTDNLYYENLIYNEYFCLKLAKSIGLSVAIAEIRECLDIKYLLIERYDRYDLQGLKRIHQEDFCQALGIVPEKKYQNEGGPSLAQCFDLIRKISATPIIDINKLISAVIFNFIIGNCDAHGKNFSILYRNGIEMAPLYDLVCTRYYPNLTSKMAMKIGGEYDVKKVSKVNFEKMAKEIGVGKALLLNRAHEISEKILSVLDQYHFTHPVEEQLSGIIRTRCQAV